MRRILYVIQKEFRQIRRQRSYISLIFVMPFLYLLIMGSALTNEVKHVPMGIQDDDHTKASREIHDAFRGSDSFDLRGMSASGRESTKLLNDGKVKLVLVIPQHFERDMIDRRVPQLQLLVDGVDGNSAGISLAYVTGALARVQQRWARTAAGSFGVASPGAGGAAGAGAPQAAPFGSATLVPRMWYNPNLDSKLNFVPGLIAILIVTVTTFLTALNIVREKELGTLEQLLVTPIGSLELMIGKIIPFAILGLIQLGINVLATGLIHGIWMKGSLLLLYALALVFCLSTLSLGILISTLAGTQLQAFFVGQFVMIFAMMLSGFFTPVENISPAIRVLSYLNPVRYFISILREIYLKGTEFQFLWKEAAAMGIIGVVALLAAAMRFQRRLK